MRVAPRDDTLPILEGQADDSDGDGWKSRTAGGLRGCVIAVQGNGEPMVAVREARSRCARRRRRRLRSIREMRVDERLRPPLNTCAVQVLRRQERKRYEGNENANRRPEPDATRLQESHLSALI
jgi:hypothetical protein